MRSGGELFNQNNPEEFLLRSSQWRFVKESLSVPAKSSLCGTRYPVFVTVREGALLRQILCSWLRKSLTELREPTDALKIDVTFYSMETPVILFEEVQRSGRMKHKWFYGIVAIIFGLVLVFDHISSRPNLAFTAFLWSGLVIFIFLQIFSLYGFELITQIREDGIYIRFTPYQPSFERIPWEDIVEIHVRKFDPFKEYGYGVRMTANGRGYTIPGDTGIYLVLRNQSPVMISTKCAEEFIETLKKMGRIK